MKTKFSSKEAITISLLAVLLVTNWSCKENAILPKKLVPGVDNINTFDSTFDLITHTLYQDSFLTGGLKSGLQLSSASTFYMACGTIKADPYFGKTVASMHVEIIPPVPNFTFKDSTHKLSIDSVVLSIPFKTAYGDTSATAEPQVFRVYRSLDTFPRTSPQFEFTKDIYNSSDLLSSLAVDLNTISSDSPMVGGVKQQPQLRFKLDAKFGDSLKAQIDLGANGAFATFTNFLAWWKGFAIVPDSLNGNTLGYFETYKTRLTVYYRHPKTGGGEDTTSDVFAFDPSYCNRFNSITRNYAGKPAANFINTNAVLGDSVLFLQNEPGLVNVIKMPGIANMENVIVNKAELVFIIDPQIDTMTYSCVPRLQIFKTDSTGNNDKVAEDYAAFNSSNYVDGRRTSVIINGQTYFQYKFTVTYSVQKIISQKDSTFRFKIMGANIGLPAAYRSVLFGSSSHSADLKPKLYVIYTKINKL